MTDPIEVELGWYEMYQAGKVGWHRHVEAVYKRKLRTRLMGKKKNYIAHIEGAIGEIAVAKAANRYWGGTVNVGKKVADVGDHVEVRCRDETAGERELIVREDDPDDRIMVLVTWKEDEMPKLKVWGWIQIKKAKKKKYIANPGGYGTCYLVPKTDLNPMKEMP